MRQSPYMQRNILKYQPASLLPAEGNLRNQLNIQSNEVDLKKYINYQNYIPTQPPVQEERPCYFCNKTASSEKCGDCNRTICSKCKYLCGRCGKILCQLNKTYDYE